MSYNPNGPRNTVGTPGTTGMTGTTGSTSYGTTGASYEVGTSGTSRTVPVESTDEATEGLRAKAEHLAGNVKEKATQLGHTMSDKANAAVTSVGEKMTDMASALRDKAPSSVAPYADRAAETLERAGTYLQQGDLGDFFDDLSGIIRRHPVPAMLTGVALGFMLARNSRR